MPESINVESVINQENVPYVKISYQEKSGTLSVADARTRAIALIRAITISETEATIFEALRLDKKGFGKPSKKEEQLYGGLLHLIRSARPELPKDINPIFGYNTKLPLVDYLILGDKVQLQIEEALHHAQCLLECAEGAERDAFMYQFSDRVGLSRSAVQELLLEMAEFRKISYLESLL